MIKPEQIPDEAAESDYITQHDWHKPLRATPTATNALPGTGHCHRDEQTARLTAENAKLRAALKGCAGFLDHVGWPMQADRARVALEGK
jgi:hypothetical protein